MPTKLGVLSFTVAAVLTTLFIWVSVPVKPVGADWVPFGLGTIGVGCVAGSVVGVIVDTWR
jgi:hypothetical protein